MDPQAVTFDAPLKQATTVPVPAGVTFDSQLNAATSVPVGSQGSDQSVSPAPKQTPQATIRATPEPSGVLERVQRWSDNVSHDLKYGTDLTGIGAVLKAMGAHGVYNGNTEAVGDFMASLPLGLLRSIKGAAELPQSGKHWQGTKDVVGGGLQAATIPGSFIAPEASEVAANGLGTASDAVASGASKAASAIKKPFSLKAVQEALEGSKESIQQSLHSNLQGIQDAWHNTVRDLFDAVAKDAGVEPKPAKSLNDVAANVAHAVKSKASSLYKQLDAAVGGTRFQTFDEQIDNVKRTLRNSAGIDPDNDGRLIERINQLEDAKTAALELAKSKGVDPNPINTANRTHQQAMALSDLSKHVQSSISGLRADLANGAKVAQESLSPAKLTNRVNRMFNTGRLQQAIGEGRADDLLRAIEETKQKAADAAQNAVKATEAAVSNAAQKADSVKLRRVVAGAALAGVPGFTLLKHLLGE